MKKTMQVNRVYSVRYGVFCVEGEDVNGKGLTANFRDSQLFDSYQSHFNGEWGGVPEYSKEETVSHLQDMLFNAAENRVIRNVNC